MRPSPPRRRAIATARPGSKSAAMTPPWTVSNGGMRASCTSRGAVPWGRRVAGTAGRPPRGPGAVGGVPGHGDPSRPARHDADLIPEMEVDRGGSDLIGGERVDGESPGRDFTQDHIACE